MTFFSSGKLEKASKVVLYNVPVTKPDAETSIFSPNLEIFSPAIISSGAGKIISKSLMGNSKSEVPSSTIHFPAGVFTKEWIFPFSGTFTVLPAAQ